MVLRRHGAGGSPYEADSPDAAPGSGDVVARVCAAAACRRSITDSRPDPVKQELVMRAAMRPEIGRGRGSGQWLGGPIAAINDTAAYYALVVLLGRHCRRSASGSIICVRRSTPR